MSLYQMRKFCCHFPLRCIFCPKSQSTACVMIVHIKTGQSLFGMIKKLFLVMSCRKN